MNEELENETILELWEKVLLSLECDGNKSEFSSRVEDIKKNIFQLEMPIRQSGSSVLNKGDVVGLSYNRKNSAYLFKASILDFFGEESRSINVMKISDTERMQRRRYMRLDISGRIRFRNLSFPEKGGASLGAEKGGTLLNISAGGVLFECENKFKPNTILIISFSLKENRTLDNILATVKRCDGSREDGFIIGAEFITKEILNNMGLTDQDEFLPPGTGTFDENLQQIVVQYIYDEQVNLRQKGQLI